MPIYYGSGVSHERESLLAISWWHHALMFIECDVARKWEPKKMLCLPSLILNLKCTALILNSLKSAHSLSQPRLKPYWRTSENSVVLQHFLLTSDQLWLCGVCLYSVRLCKKFFFGVFFFAPWFTCRAMFPQTGNWPVTSFCLISTNGPIKLALGQACQECRCLSN